MKIKEFLLSDISDIDLSELQPFESTISKWFSMVGWIIILSILLGLYNSTDYLPYKITNGILLFVSSALMLSAFIIITLRISKRMLPKTQSTVVKMIAVLLTVLWSVSASWLVSSVADQLATLGLLK